MQEAQQVRACKVLNVVASCLDGVHPSLVWLAFQNGVQVMAQLLSATGLQIIRSNKCGEQKIEAMI